MKYRTQDITTVDRGIIVHGVNCMRQMNSGVAAAIRKKWPEVYRHYTEMPAGKEMLGTTHLVLLTEGLYVANCYTQFQYGYDGGRYADLASVEKCLSDCYGFADLHGLPLCSVKIGAGRGGLSWEEEVEPIFLRLNREYTSVATTIYYV